MTDREKLEELIVEAKRQWQGGTNNIDGRIADHLIANGVTFAKDTNDSGNWISVKERLPEPYIPVITARKRFDGKGCDYEVDYISFRYSEKLLWSSDLRTWRSVVTHWMPLPEPPKEE